MWFLNYLFFATQDLVLSRSVLFLPFWVRYHSWKPKTRENGWNVLAGYRNGVLAIVKVGCVFQMVIWFKFNVGSLETSNFRPSRVCIPLYTKLLFLFGPSQFNPTVGFLLVIDSIDWKPCWKTTIQGSSINEPSCGKNLPEWPSAVFGLFEWIWGDIWESWRIGLVEIGLCFILGWFLNDIGGGFIKLFICLVDPRNN